MSKAAMACPECGLSATRKNGRDRQGRQILQCRGCRRRFTARSATPFAGYRFPPEIIALAVRWYLRYRLSYADAAELLAERGVRVDPSTLFDWVREFTPLYEDAARPFRRAVGTCWSVDETCTKIAGKPAYVYRAIDGRGQVVDVYVRQRRAAADAAAFFRRASAATGVIPDEVATDGAACDVHLFYPVDPFGTPGMRVPEFCPGWILCTPRIFPESPGAFIGGGAAVAHGDCWQTRRTGAKPRPRAG